MALNKILSIKSCYLLAVNFDSLRSKFSSSVNDNCLHRSQIFIICFSDNDRDNCFQFTMTKSVKNLIDNI